MSVLKFQGFNCLMHIQTRQLAYSLNQGCKDGQHRRRLRQISMDIRDSNPGPRTWQMNILATILTGRLKFEFIFQVSHKFSKEQR